MAKTFTPRFGLPQWSSGQDTVSRGDFNAALAVIEANAAMDTQGTMATRPAYGKRGRYYQATDTGKLYRDSGTSWDLINPTPEWGTVANKPSTFPATAHNHAPSEITSAGTLSVQAARFTGIGDVTPATISTVPTTFTSNITEWKKGTNTLAFMSAMGVLSSQAIKAQGDVSTGLVPVDVYAGSSSSVKAQQWRNSAGTVRASVDYLGNIESLGEVKGQTLRSESTLSVNGVATVKGLTSDGIVNANQGGTFTASGTTTPAATAVVGTSHTGNIMEFKKGTGTVVSLRHDGLMTVTALTTAGAVSAGSVSATTVASTGASTAASFTATGQVKGATVVATGAATAVSFTATGEVKGATVVATGAATAVSFTATGEVKGATVVATGRVTANGVDANASVGTALTATASATGVRPAAFAGVPGQTANLTEWRIGSTVLVTITATGTITAPAATLTAATPTSTPLTLKGTTGQAQSGPLTSWRDATNKQVASMNGDGDLSLGHLYSKSINTRAISGSGVPLTVGLSSPAEDHFANLTEWTVGSSSYAMSWIDRDGRYGMAYDETKTFTKAEIGSTAGDADGLLTVAREAGIVYWRGFLQRTFTATRTMIIGYGGLADWMDGRTEQTRRFVAATGTGVPCVIELDDSGALFVEFTTVPTGRTSVFFDGITYLGRFI